ncbi:MAG: hypothetical protein LBD91_04165 [Prevotellaceae bacterium]|nr:hypothetical protein [Prevotellaceae bacterium]
MRLYELRYGRRRFQAVWWQVYGFFHLFILLRHTGAPRLRGTAGGGIPTGAACVALSRLRGAPVGRGWNSS